jgi:hypothetical protein
VIKLKVPEANHNHYWRLLLTSTATFIDYGSWSKFIAIIPPISMKELTGENDD